MLLDAHFDYGEFGRFRLLVSILIKEFKFIISLP